MAKGMTIKVLHMLMPFLIGVAVAGVVMMMMMMCMLRRCRRR